MQSNYAPRTPNEIAVAQAVRDAMPTFGAGFAAATQPVRLLALLNLKARRTGSPIFAGVGLAERARRRAAGRVAKASRKANR